MLTRRVFPVIAVLALLAPTAAVPAGAVGFVGGPPGIGNGAGGFNNARQILLCMGSNGFWQSTGIERLQALLSCINFVSPH